MVWPQDIRFFAPWGVWVPLTTGEAACGLRTPAACNPPGDSLMAKQGGQEAFAGLPRGSRDLGELGTIRNWASPASPALLPHAALPMSPLPSVLALPPNPARHLVAQPLLVAPEATADSQLSTQRVRRLSASFHTWHLGALSPAALSVA